MTLTILNVIYVLVALAMTVLILMQRGAGAQAGSGFGAGASGTVFGSKGASNFLSKSTKWLAIAFFVLSLGMGMFVVHGAKFSSSQDLGVMGKQTSDTKTDQVTPDAATLTPRAGDVPAPPVSATTSSDVPKTATGDEPKSETKTNTGTAPVEASTSSETVTPNAVAAPSSQVPVSDAAKEEKKKN